MNPRDVLLGRRTVHRFENRPVPADAVQRALECAAYAPNHKTTSPWRFHLLGAETAAAVTERNAAMLRETKGEAAAEHKRKRWSEMPGWLVVTCRRSSDSLRQQEDYAACACAIQNFMLSLHSEGLASKWSTGTVTRDNEFLELLGVDPDAEFTAGLIWYGYAAEQPETRRTDYTDSLVHHP